MGSRARRRSRNLVVARVGIVEKPALFDEQLLVCTLGNERTYQPRGRSPSVARWTRCAVQVVSLLLPRHLGHLGPSPSVTEHLVTRLGDQAATAGLRSSAWAHARWRPAPRTGRGDGRASDPCPAAELEVGLGPDVPHVRAELYEYSPQLSLRSSPSRSEYSAPDS